MKRARERVNRRRILLASGLLWAASAFALPARAQAPAPRVEEGGARFEKGAREWGLSLGQGTGLALWGSAGEDAEDVRFTGLVPRFGLGLSDPVAVESWYGGNLELLVEGALLVAYEPKGGTLSGANVLVRYNFLSWRRLVPFVEIGAGLAYLDLDLDSQSDGLGFTPQGGLGFHWWLSPRVALTASWRLHHLSNAGIYNDNVGINGSLILVGFSYFPGSG
jgi:hypothetical protein